MNINYIYLVKVTMRHFLVHEIWGAGILQEVYINLVKILQDQ